jgi:hypothetical protein
VFENLTINVFLRSLQVLEAFLDDEEILNHVPACDVGLGGRNIIVPQIVDDVDGDDSKKGGDGAKLDAEAALSQLSADWVGSVRAVAC